MGIEIYYHLYYCTYGQLFSTAAPLALSKQGNKTWVKVTSSSRDSTCCARVWIFSHAYSMLRNFLLGDWPLVHTHTLKHVFHILPASLVHVHTNGGAQLQSFLRELDSVGQGCEWGLVSHLQQNGLSHRHWFVFFCAFPPDVSGWSFVMILTLPPPEVISHCES